MNNSIVEGYNNKLKNKLFGLLCEYEKDGPWEQFLDAIIIELQGFPEELKTINYLTICNKVNMLRYLRYEYFRKTVFDCMSLLSRDKNDGIL